MPKYHRELEAKFCILNPNAMEKRLKKLAGELVRPRTHEFNMRFDTPSKDLARQHLLLRLRRDHTTRLTFKGPASIHRRKATQSRQKDHL
jgi:adenylate cyclase class IV